MKDSETTITPSVIAIYIAVGKGEPVNRASRVHALEGSGLQGDRYCRESRETEEAHCQVTLIGAEDLREAETACGVRVSNGEHRRNLVISGIDLESLNGKRFRIGEAVLEYSGQRPPCGYLESLTQRGMKEALTGKGGICVQVISSGWINEGDTLELLGS